jgi:D-lactate dehydrogenase
MPRAVNPRLADVRRGSDLTVVYFPSCVARTMGPGRGDPDEVAVHRAVTSLLEKAGCDVVFPPGLEGLCCGMAFESKGFPVEAEKKLRELEGALLEASQGGRHPVLFDTSPCAYRTKRVLGGGKLAVHDPVEGIAKLLLPRLQVTKVPGPVALHVTCSATKAGLAATYQAVAAACAEQVVVPAGVGCCGFAGDRGFTHPELNASALAALPAAVRGCAEGFSSSRTCEIGLSLHAGFPYRSLAVLVDRCATAKAARSTPLAAGAAGTAAQEANG